MTPQKNDKLRCAKQISYERPFCSEVQSDWCECYKCRNPVEVPGGYLPSPQPCPCIFFVSPLKAASRPSPQNLVLRNRKRSTYPMNNLHELDTPRLNVLQEPEQTKYVITTVGFRGPVVPKMLQTNKCYPYRIMRPMSIPQ